MSQFKSFKQLIKVLLILAALAAAFSAVPAGAERLRINPVPPHVVPQWMPMPDLPQVYHAPNLPTDVFRHQGRYYFFWEGIWYQGKSTKGPWKRLQQPPAILSRIQPAYFKPQAGGSGGQPPAAMPPGAMPPSLPPGLLPGGPPGPPPGEGLITPEGKPAVPPPPAAPTPTEPVPPTPPAGGVAPPPQETPAPEPPAPPQVPEGQSPETAPPGPPPKAM